MPALPLTRILLLALLASLCATARITHAAVYCVGSESELSAALAVGQSNGEDDEIRLRAGIYFSDGKPYGGFAATVSDARGFSILGGWIDAACTVHRDDPTLSVIDGNHANGAMTLSATRESSNAVRLAWLTFRNGAGHVGYGLNLGSPDYVTMPMVVENCVFRDNHNFDGYYGRGALYFVGDAGFLLRNSLFVGNRGTSASSVYMAGGMHSGYPVPAMINNTFTGNETLTDSQTIQIVGGPIRFANNVVWGNIKPSPAAIDFYAFMAMELRNNDIEHLDVTVGGGPWPDSGGNISVDPGFTGQGNYRPHPDSPLRNTGYVASAGELGALDLAGTPRVLEGTVDIGAYEIDRLFADGFEAAP